MASSYFLSEVHFLVYPVFLSVFLFMHKVNGMTVVEGFDGGSVVLPCTLPANGDLNWKQGLNLILIKQPSGTVIIPDRLYKGDVSLVNSADLRISPVRRNREGDNVGDKTFECVYTGGGKQQIQLKLLVRITDVTIPEANGGSVTVTTGTPKTLTCSVAGDPNPPPSYSWGGNDVTVSGQTSSSYNFTPDKSMKNVTCTATNIYSNGSLLSVKEATATLNVQYLDPVIKTDPFIATENNRAILKCSVEGNPPPRYEWRRSGFSEVKSSSADYIIDDVHRSAAGEYTCRYNNTIGSNSITAKLIVQYPPDVTVSYDNTTQTLTCTAEGVPGNYNFSPWEHRLDGKLLQTLGTKSSGSIATLKLPDTLTYEDTGYYVCQASNGIKSLQRGQLLITPQTPPVFQRHSETETWIEGETGSIYVPFYTYPYTPYVTVVWKKSGDTTVLASHGEETGPVRLIIRKKSVGIVGTVTLLTLRDVSQSDEGNYTVTVSNNIYDAPVQNQTTIYVSVVKPEMSAAQLATIVGEASGALILILIIIIIIIIIVRRRSTHFKNSGGKKKKKSNKKDHGSENEAFSGDRWKQPDAEIAVNEFYGSFSRKQHRKGPKPVPKMAKPAKAQKKNVQKAHATEDTELDTNTGIDRPISALYATVQKKPQE